MKDGHQTYKANLIKKEISAANALLLTLQEEFNVLKNTATPETIKNLSIEKDNHITALNVISNERMSVLPVTDPMLAEQPFKSLWDNLLEVAKECQKQNQINGTIINTTKRHIDLAATILTGAQPATELRYGSSGKTVSERQQRTIAKA